MKSINILNITHPDDKTLSLNAVKNAAVKKDVLTPFVTALRKNDLKVGIYYSLSDWSNNDYTNFTKAVSLNMSFK